MRSNSHLLQIERGRHTKPKTPIENRLCKTCLLVEDELHFITNCAETTENRKVLYNKIAQLDSSFIELHDNEKMMYLFNSQDRTILTWFGKFLHNSFKEKRLRIQDKC